MSNPLSNAFTRQEIRTHAGQICDSMPRLQQADLIGAANEIKRTLMHAMDHIELLEFELRTKNNELHTLRFIGQTPEHLDVQPGALQIVPGPPTLIQRIKAAIAALKGK